MVKSVDTFSLTQALAGLSASTYKLRPCQLTPGIFIKYDSLNPRIELLTTDLKYSSMTHQKIADSLKYDGFFTLSSNLVNNFNKLD